ncbi:MAG: PAS domain S-box protein [Hylemonella sp.]|nr:PAS domain S-box protein [Hylemonella sp.]
MTFSYQWPLVAFSVLIAILASYTTLRLAYRLAWASRTSRPWWIAGGAVAMGVGIWATHFVGMLALHLPVPVAYDPGLTALSVLPAILASAVALHTLARRSDAARARLMAALLMGLGIVTMHYSGMQAMRMTPPIVYDPWLLALSAVIAVAASWSAMALVLQDRARAGMSFARRLASALVMGVAIAGMHYTGMAAARFAPDAVSAAAQTGWTGSAIGLFVGLVAVLVLAASLALTFFDEVTGENSFYRALLAAQSDAGEAVLVIHDGRVVYANVAMQRFSGYSEAELQALPSWTALIEGQAPELPPVTSVSEPPSDAGRQEAELRTRTGDARSCELVLSGFRHADSIRHLLVCIDVSKRKATEAALRASEAQTRELALVASSTDNAVIIMDARARISWVNQGFTKMCGYSLEEAVGRRPSDLLNGPATDPKTLAFIQDKLSRSERFETEIVHYHKSGRPYWAVVDVQVVRDELGGASRYISIERDITRSKEAEEALRQSEARLKEAQQLARLGSWNFDFERDAYLMSEEALRIHEFESASGWISRAQLRESVHPDDRELLRLKRDVAMTHSQDFSAKLRLLFAQGRIKHVQLRGAFYKDAQGKPVRISGTIQDITEQQLADMALRVSEANLKEAQQLARAGSFESDLTSQERKIFLSEEALRIHELNAPDGHVPAAAVLSRIPEEDMIEYQRQRQEAIATGGRLSAQHRIVLPDGRVKHVHIRARAVMNSQGQALKLIGSIQDITEQKHAELALRRLNETLEQRVLERTHELDQQRSFIETILETADTLIFVVDNHGRFVRFNRACERLTGYTFDELRGQPIWESVVTPERRLEVRRKHEDVVFPDQLTRHLEVEWRAKDGRRRLLSWNNAMITNAQGRLEYMIGTGIDITERKRAEQALIVANQSLSTSIENLRQTQSQLVQAEKMASLGGLVAGISHEINTPLGIGVTSATAMQEDLHSLKREFEAGTIKRSMLERFLQQSIEGSDILVRNLLRAAELIRSFKQVAVDQSSDEQREVDLGRYIDEVILSLQPRFKGSRVRVVNQSQPGLRLHTNPGVIYQILSNLVINALIHAYDADQDGTIRLFARRTGDEVQIDCADDGRGISPEIRDRIFDPFFTTRRGSGGSGLGLHIVFNLVVTALDGSVHLVKDVEKGATFRISFPLTTEQQHGNAGQG